MAIKVGDKIPSMKLNKLGPNGMTQVATDDIFKGKTVIMFGLPGAFTPTCSARHVPGYLDKMSDLKAKGVDSVVCLSVNDPFVMKAWGENQKVGENIAKKWGLTREDQDQLAVDSHSRAAWRNRAR